MRRRYVIRLFGGAVAAWPSVVCAQQPARALPLIGFLQPGSPADSRHYASAFLRGLTESGYVEDENVTIAWRWAEGHYDRLPVLASDLVRNGVAVIAAGGPPSTHAAKAATSTIPIIFIAGDPTNAETFDLVGSLNRPGSWWSLAVQRGLRAKTERQGRRP